MDETISSMPEAEQRKLLFHASGEGRVDVIGLVLSANSRLRGALDEDLIWKQLG